VDYLNESPVSIYRRRRRRRAVITLMIVTSLLLATVLYAASYVEGWVGTTTPNAVANASCFGAGVKPARKPGDVTVNVYNSTPRPGLAQSVASTLEEQGFTVAAVDNDPLGRTVPGVGEIRHGPSGATAAVIAGARLPGVGLVQDDRANTSVDLVLGHRFRKLYAPPKKIHFTAAQLAPRC
jgi:LytR cell envelope-related transcriptional attenuator